MYVLKSENVSIRLGMGQNGELGVNSEMEMEMEI